MTGEQRLAFILAIKAPSQGTAAHFLRRNKLMLTASEFADVMCRGYNKGKGRDILLEEKTGGKRREIPSFVKMMMDWGNDLEEEARDHFAIKEGLEVFETGCVYHSDLWENHIPVGASPDGLVVVDGELWVVEIKCPYKRVPQKGIVPPIYKDQIQGQIWVLGAVGCFFIQYVPPRGQNDRILYVDKVLRDDSWAPTTVPHLISFIEEVMKRRCKPPVLSTSLDRFIRRG